MCTMYSVYFFLENWKKKSIFTKQSSPINVRSIRIWFVYLFQDDGVTITILQNRTKLSIDDGYNAENCKYLLGNEETILSELNSLRFSMDNSW